jgi:cyclohexadienyl dehydratase
VLNLKRWFPAGLAAIALLMLTAPPSAWAGERLDRILDSKALRVGTPGDYRPFAIKEGAGYSGHDIDTV